MKVSRVSLIVSALLCAAVLLPLAVARQQPDAAKEQQAMLEKAKNVTQPGKHHKLLEKFLGKWDTETRLAFAGQAARPDKGTAECSWLMKDRWLKGDATGTMMGRPLQIHWIMGYDNFKMAYVITTVSNMDTAMMRLEGRLDPNGKVLLAYGTIDEYLTGEHDKMVKYVWRFVSDDKMVLEIHDLAIGESNTKVLEITYQRQS